MIEEEGYGRVFLLLSLTAHVSLFPLLHQPSGRHACTVCPSAKFSIYVADCLVTYMNTHVFRVVCRFVHVHVYMYMYVQCKCMSG